MAMNLDAANAHTLLDCELGTTISTPETNPLPFTLAKIEVPVKMLLE
jgi:hypothetical protein